MTEQEFRDALKKSVDHTGLSSERQMKVLAQMKGEGKQVRKGSSRMKLILVLAVIAALSVTGAVAGGLGGVDWNGEPTQMPQAIPLSATEQGARVQELFRAPEKGQIVNVVNMNPQEGQIAGIFDSSSDFYASSLEEMAAWVKADGSLAWPVYIPEEYRELRMGRVSYVCSSEGSFELVSREKTDDGYLRYVFEMPEEHRFMSSYFLSLLNEQGEELIVNVAMYDDLSVENAFAVTEDSEVMVLTVEGMDQALAVVSPEETLLAMRCVLEKPLSYTTVESGYDGSVRQYDDELQNLVIKIIAPDMTASDMLAIFGLKVQ